LKLCGSEESSRRDLVVRFIVALFRLHPINTCQPSHVIPLLRIYGGTISASDRNQLSIFRLYHPFSPSGHRPLVYLFQASLMQCKTWIPYAC
jgi:hypothetical protein